MTQKKLITLPKKSRDALRLILGDAVDFDVNREVQVVVYKAGGRATATRDRFDTALGNARVKWRSADLMALLRGAD